MPQAQPAFSPPDDFTLGGDPLPDNGLITVQYIEKTRVTAQVTPEQARQLFGLGGTPDDQVGARIAAITHHTSSLLARLGPHSTEEVQLSWELNKLRDPWDADTYL